VKLLLNEWLQCLFSATDMITVSFNYTSIKPRRSTRHPGLLSLSLPRLNA